MLEENLMIYMMLCQKNKNMSFLQIYGRQFDHQMITMFLKNTKLKK